MRWSREKVVLSLLVLLILFFQSAFSESVCKPVLPETAQVDGVAGGNTLLLMEGERVRLIGVFTPEVHEPEAMAFTNSLVSKKMVKLKYDESNASIGHKDRYGRLLAYVYLPDNTFVNAEIIKEGHGHAYTCFPFRHIEEFRGYEKQARKEKRGLWAAEKPEPTTNLIKVFYYIFPFGIPLLSLFVNNLPKPARRADFIRIHRALFLQGMMLNASSYFSYIYMVKNRIAPILQPKWDGADYWVTIFICFLLLCLVILFDRYFSEVDVASGLQRKFKSKTVGVKVEAYTEMYWLYVILMDIAALGPTWYVIHTLSEV